MSCELSDALWRPNWEISRKRNHTELVPIQQAVLAVAWRWEEMGAKRAPIYLYDHVLRWELRPNYVVYSGNRHCCRWRMITLTSMLFCPFWACWIITVYREIDWRNEMFLWQVVVGAKGMPPDDSHVVRTRAVHLGWLLIQRASSSLDWMPGCGRWRYTCSKVLAYR